MNKLSRMIALLLLLLALFSVNTAHAVEEVWSKDLSEFVLQNYPDAGGDTISDSPNYNIRTSTGSFGSCVLVFETEDLPYYRIDFQWFDKNGNHLKSVGLTESGINIVRVSDSSLVLAKGIVGGLGYGDGGWIEKSFLRFIEQDSDSGWIPVNKDKRYHSVGLSQSDFLSYISGNVVHVIKVGSSSTSASNTNTSEGSGSDTETATTSTNYKLLSSWCYFSEYPWVYSYTNNSWYYLMPSNSGLYAWNENITGDWFNVGDN